MQGAADGFVRAYKAQIAVEQEFQLIVRQAVTQEANDKEQLREIVKTIKKQSGQTPSKFWPTAVTVRRRCWRLSNTPLRKVNPSIFVLRSGGKNTASPQSPASEDRDLSCNPHGLRAARKGIVEIVLAQFPSSDLTEGIPDPMAYTFRQRRWERDAAGSCRRSHRPRTALVHSTVPSRFHLRVTFS